MLEGRKEEREKGGKKEKKKKQKKREEMGKNWALLDKMILPKRVGGKVAVAFSVTLNFFAHGIKLGAG